MCEIMKWAKEWNESPADGGYSKIWLAVEEFDGKVYRIEVRMPLLWYEPSESDLVVMENTVWTTSKGAMIAVSSYDDISRGFLNFAVNPMAANFDEKAVVTAMNFVVNKWLFKCKNEKIIAANG